MKLLVTRHGETDFNVQKRYAGSTDVPLNARGLEQAQALAQRLINQPLDVIVVSPLTRARQTADAVHRLRPELPVVVMEEFAERNVGVYEGLTGAEIQQRYPQLWARGCTRRTDDAPDGGETVRQLDQRIARGLAKLKEAYADKTVLLVCHGGVSKAINRQMTGLSYDEMYDFVLGNGEVAEYMG